MFTQELAANQFNLRGATPPKNHTFTTLTLPAPQMHCDKIIKRESLNHFLIEMKRRWKVKNFMWKAEAQHNGNIHFHLLTDKYMEWQQIQWMWNRAINRLGYVDWFTHEHNHMNPNSTDIHALKKLNNVTAYFCKYFSKEGHSRTLCGHQWYASDNVKCLRAPTFVIDNQMWDSMNTLRSRAIPKEKEDQKYSVNFTEENIDFKRFAPAAKREIRELVKHNLNLLIRTPS